MSNITVLAKCSLVVFSGWLTEGHPGAMNAKSRATETHLSRLVLKPRSTLSGPWRPNSEPWSLTLEPWRITMEQRRLNVKQRSLICYSREKVHPQKHGCSHWNRGASASSRETLPWSGAGHSVPDEAYSAAVKAHCKAVEALLEKWRRLSLFMVSNVQCKEIYVVVYVTYLNNERKYTDLLWSLDWDP